MEPRATRAQSARSVRYISRIALPGTAPEYNPASPRIPFKLSPVVPSQPNSTWLDPTAGVAEQLVHTFVRPPPVVPLAEVAIFTPPYSVTVPALPTCIVIVGYPVAFAWAEIATKYHVFALIAALLVQKLVLVVFVPPYSTHRSPGVLRPTITSTVVLAAAASVENTGMARAN